MIWYTRNVCLHCSTYQAFTAAVENALWIEHLVVVIGSVLSVQCSMRPQQVKSPLYFMIYIWVVMSYGFSLLYESWIKRGKSWLNSIIIIYIVSRMSIYSCTQYSKRDDTHLILNVNNNNLKFQCVILSHFHLFSLYIVGWTMEGPEITFLFQFGNLRDMVTVSAASITLKSLKDLACDFINAKVQCHNVTNTNIVPFIEKKKIKNIFLYLFCSNHRFLKTEWAI